YVDEFAPRLSYFWDVHNDFFEEIAKFRAGRRMWAKLMRERFHAKSPRSWLLRTHAQTAGVSLMAQQPMNNVVRTTLQALAAVLGGTQSLHTNAYDETYALPTAQSARLALRTQQISAEGEEPIPTLKIDLTPEKEQVERLVAVRARRDAERARSALERVRRAARGDDNLFPPILDAVRADVTLGEVCDVFREVWGEHRD